MDHPKRPLLAAAFCIALLMTASATAIQNFPISDEPGVLQMSGGVAFGGANHLPPLLAVEPASVAVGAGGAAGIAVEAYGAPPLFFRWRKNGAAVSDGGRVSGSKTALLTISSVKPGDAGSYSVLVSNLFGHVVSSNAILTVITNPAIQITAPLSGQRISNSVFIAKGTVRHQVPLMGVYCQFNGSPVSPATMKGSSSWTVSLSLVPGINTLSVFCVDSVGNFSPTKTIQFHCVPTATLGVYAVGRGFITPDDNAKSLALGTNYTLTATAFPGWWFSNWIGGTALPYSVLSSSPAYTFSMQPNLVLVADFVRNPYLAAQGAYHGLFVVDGAPREQTNSGYFTFALTTNGTASGKIILGAATNLWTAKFAVDGTATARFLRTGKTNTLTLALDFADQSVSGALSDGSFTAQVNGDRGIFGAIHKATNLAGRYTVVIPGSEDPTIGPFGAGYGVAVIDSVGNITFSGSLADGTPVSQATVVSRDGFWPMYVSLYGGKGSLWSWNIVRNRFIFQSPDASWINATNAARTAMLGAGFTNQAAKTTTSWYDSTSRPLFGFTNGIISLEGGDLPNLITNGFTVSAKNKITVAAPNTNKIVLTINPTNGVVSGSFANPLHPSQTILFNGVLVQNNGILAENAAHVAGYFPGSSNSGSVLLAPKQ